MVSFIKFANCWSRFNLWAQCCSSHSHVLPAVFFLYCFFRRQSLLSTFSLPLRTAIFCLNSTFSFLSILVPFGGKINFSPLSYSLSVLLWLLLLLLPVLLCLLSTDWSCLCSSRPLLTIVQLLMSSPPIKAWVSPLLILISLCPVPILGHLSLVLGQFVRWVWKRWQGICLLHNQKNYVKCFSCI